MARGKAKSSSSDKAADNNNNMRVATLRKMLDEKGYQLDCTFEGEH